MIFISIGLIIWNSLKPGTWKHFPPSPFWCIPLTSRGTTATSVTQRRPQCGTMTKFAQTGTELAQAKPDSRKRSAPRPKIPTSSSLLWTVRRGTSYEGNQKRPVLEPHVTKHILCINQGGFLILFIWTITRTRGIFCQNEQKIFKGIRRLLIYFILFVLLCRGTKLAMLKCHLQCPAPLCHTEISRRMQF